MEQKLIIVQNKPTQFDAPLYAFVQRKSVFDLTVYYTETCHETDVSIDPEIGRAPQWDHLHSCKYVRKDLSAAKSINAVKVANEIAGYQPSLVILIGYFPPLHAKLAWLLKRRGVRIGLRSDNTIPHSSFKGVKGVIKNLFLPFWLKRYDTWHPVGTLARQYLEKTANTKKPTYLFPYNVDNDWFAVESSKHRRNRDAIRTEMGLSSHDFVVLGIMKWHNREDPLTLIDAFAKLKHRYPKARLVLVGDGPLRDNVSAKAKLLGNSIFLPGYAPYSDLPKYYAISDVFVHPAVDEPWGVSVNEAMACSVPVIAAEGVGAATDLITEWETGAVYPNRDIDLLTEKLSRLINDQEFLAKMSKAAKKRVSEWNYEQTSREMILAIEG
jgi:glycosyltransferase involved in cell wall biosynthesis